MRSLWMARSVRCLCIGLHSGSIRPRKDGAGGLEGVSGRWGVGRKEREKRQPVLNHQRGRMRYWQAGGAARKKKSQSEKLSNLEAESRPEETSDCV